MKKSLVTLVACSILAGCWTAPPRPKQEGESLARAVPADGRVARLPTPAQLAAPMQPSFELGPELPDLPFTTIIPIPAIRLDDFDDGDPGIIRDLPEDLPPLLVRKTSEPKLLFPLVPPITEDPNMMKELERKVESLTGPTSGQWSLWEIPPAIILGTLAIFLVLCVIRRK